MIGPENPSSDAVVSLREVTAETVRSICKLSDTLSDAQKHMVAPNAVSIAEAHFSEHAWFRAIYADDTPVGFVMLYIGPDDEGSPDEVHFLWRYMIDARYQKLGFGKRALDLLIEHVRSRPNAHELSLSCHPGGDGPEPFYRQYGFSRTGEFMGGEAVMRMDI